MRKGMLKSFPSNCMWVPTITLFCHSIMSLNSILRACMNTKLSLASALTSFFTIFMSIHVVPIFLRHSNIYFYICPSVLHAPKYY